jgi:hypothetical protein
MKSGVTAEEWQLLSFFEVEPSLRDSDVPWCYNDAVYEVHQGDLALSFAIAPGYRDVRIILQHEGERLYELNAMDVKDVRYTNDGGQEQLEVALNDRESILLRIKPRVELTHKFDGRP